MVYHWGQSGYYKDGNGVVQFRHGTTLGGSGNEFKYAMYDPANPTACGLLTVADLPMNPNQYNSGGQLQSNPYQSNTPAENWNVSQVPYVPGGSGTYYTNGGVNRRMFITSYSTSADRSSADLKAARCKSRFAFASTEMSMKFPIGILTI